MTRRYKNMTLKTNFRGPLKAVILDWAGTIVDYGSRAPAMVFVEVFKRWGVGISLSQARGPMGMAKKDHIREISRLPEVTEIWKTKYGSLPSEEDVEEMYRMFIPLQLDALAKHTDLIPGTLEAVAVFREMGLKIGSNTGYSRDMLNIVLKESRKLGFEPDSAVSASDVPAGRPEPWMSLKNAMEMRVYPMAACVKIDDTIPGIEEGLNAGMWTIGLVKTGNEIGLDETEIAALSPDDLDERVERGYRRMEGAGAHFAADGIWDVPAILRKINELLADGRKP